MDCRIFINYRTEKSSEAAKAIYESITRHIPTSLVFKDTENIKPADHFETKIAKAIQSCDLFICVIHKNWHIDTIVKGRKASIRLEDPKDWVRREIKAILDRVDSKDSTTETSFPVILPVCVNGAYHDAGIFTPPNSNDIPPEIAPIFDYNIHHLKNHDNPIEMNRLINEVFKLIKNPLPTLGASIDIKTKYCNRDQESDGILKKIKMTNRLSSLMFFSVLGQSEDALIDFVDRVENDIQIMQPIDNKKVNVQKIKVTGSYTFSEALFMNNLIKKIKVFHEQDSAWNSKNDKNTDLLSIQVPIDTHRWRKDNLNELKIFIQNLNNLKKEIQNHPFKTVVIFLCYHLGADTEAPRKFALKQIRNKKLELGRQAKERQINRYSKRYLRRDHHPILLGHISMADIERWLIYHRLEELFVRDVMQNIKLKALKDEFVYVYKRQNASKNVPEIMRMGEVIPVLNEILQTSHKS